MAFIQLDDLLDSVVVTLDPPGAAGAVTVSWAGLTLTLDLVDAGRLVQVVAPRRPDGTPPLEALGTLLGISDAMIAAVGAPPAQVVVRENAAARLVLARLTVATAGRGPGAAWDLEVAWLTRELDLACGLALVRDAPDLGRWLASVAEVGSLFGDLDPLVVPSLASDDPDLQLGFARLEARRRIGAARAGQGGGDMQTVPLLLTEQRALAVPSEWRWDGDALIGDLAGPGGSFLVEIGDLHVESDVLEPTRVIRATGLSSAPADADRAASTVIRRLQPILVLHRDLALLADEPNLRRSVALARAELSVRYSELDWPGAAELVVPTGDLAVRELVSAWGAAIGQLPAGAASMVERLGELVDTRDLDSFDLPTFRGGSRGFGSDMGATVVFEPTAEADLDALFRPIAASSIDRITGMVDLSDSARLALAPDGPGAIVTVATGPGPVATLEVVGPTPAARMLRFRLHRDLELLGELTLEVSGPIVVDLPVAGIADRLDVEVVEPATETDAEVAAQAGLLAELTGSGAATVRWLDAADLWADLGERDRAAIAIERASVLVGGDAGWRLIRRSLVLGTTWATGRVRPPETFVPIWRRRNE